ncbi:Ubiquitin carboxyl-terminal hydrolase family protein [Hibiscus syriacus]|uniref:Ubiquitin carboxyl-terminal hydrolase family protein n=1 Tax=Hibiscus syriacus TaxID=106335 RepID=A0A6A3AJL7_HIBSY|nr:Ubiquitin carboxyl-terminal hydrolase family protein [Hibiscus syriacus]
MEGLNNYGHHHPLVRLNEEQLVTNQSGLVADCSRCGEKVSAPCFRCAEDCGFYLHKVCADSPLEINHPFHHNHPLLLMQNAPYRLGGWVCHFCDKEGEKFVYHCSCGSDFHIKCALFTFNIAQNNLEELQHVSLEDPLISTKKDDEQLDDVPKCFGCWEPLANYTYFSPDSGFNLHQKCVELPLKLNHPCHRKHPLLLQFNSDRLACKICQETRRRGFVYCCSTCKFAIHIECVSPSPMVEEKNHQHPFTLFWRRVPFICDACGTEGNHVAYTCGTCGIILQKRCVSLPRIIKSKWHDHRLFHKYFQHEEDFRTSDCIICHKEVNAEHGSYSCSKCNVIFHVNCVMEDEDSYFIVENEDDESFDISISSITNVLEWNDAGEATLIQHFKHIHHLTLSDRVSEYENKCCDGCLLPISASFYYCLQCDFFLHKVCAELPKVKHVWHHPCQEPLLLTSGENFECVKCWHFSSGFAYKCEGCGYNTCFRCVIALTPGARTCLGHNHPLFFYINGEGQCNVCGFDRRGVFLCKECNFCLGCTCFSLPVTVENKCDQHRLSLTHHDNNSYSESHYCDICEESRDPKLSLYHCATCGTTAHVDCVLGKHPFIKLGSIVENLDVHEHPLTFVKKMYYYPDCDRCESLDSEDRGVAGYYNWKLPLLFGGGGGGGTHREKWRYGEKVSAPSFRCAEDCNFYALKVCADAPSELNHPLHQHHPLVLMQRTPFSCICDFFYKVGEKFMYRCSSCDLDFHIKCALFTFNIAQNSLKELEHVALEAPMISTKKDYEQPEDVNKSVGCREPLANYTYCSPDFGFSLYKLPLELNHKVMNTHSDCFQDELSSSVMQVFLPGDFRSPDYIICHDDVRPEHGSYCCSYCNVTLNVRCVTKEASSYSIVSPDADEVYDEGSITRVLERNVAEEAITRVLERNHAGEATKIRHFKHTHILLLSSFVGGNKNSCDGCMLPISDSFYFCSHCGFLLHKACAELPQMKHVWHHYCQQPLRPISDEAFSYSENHYRDICEVNRDPNSWFYHCATCDTSAHINCVLGKYPFIKLGSIYEDEDHPHHLTFVKKSYYYPDCYQRGKPREDLALECTDYGCNYIVHWMTMGVVIIQN